MATRLRVKRRLGRHSDTSPPRPPSPPPAFHPASFPPDIDPPVPDRPRLKPGRKTLAERLVLADEGTYYLRDGDVVLFRIPNNRVWQCRYRLLAGGWRRKTTGQRNRIDAARAACQWFDEARYRERLGLTAERHLFKTAALETITELRAELAAGRGRRIYRDYATAIERYLLPFFGERSLDAIRQQHVVEFERWRDQQLGRTPAASTLLTYAAAWGRVLDTARARGWLTELDQIPKLGVRGRRTQTRPGFTPEEITALRSYLATWAVEPIRNSTKERELRLLIRDYVELLVLTGIRHGTEAMGLEWRHCAWYHDRQGTQFLRIRVAGKTGERLLIAKHEAVAVLERRAGHDWACVGKTLDQVLNAKIARRVFRFSSDAQPHDFGPVFRRVLKSAGLLKDSADQVRTLYSLRHTYATQELTAGTDIHTLARQMGTSVVMLERHYSKLTASMAADRLAG